MVLELKKEVRQVKFLLKGRTEERRVEVRFDPITGRRCRVLEKAILVPPGADFSEILGEEDCPFCGKAFTEGVPDFMPDVIPEGKLKLRNVTLVPNLFPYADHTAVVVFRDHYIPVDRFSHDDLGDALRVAQRYIARVFRMDPKARFCSINWNYMPPSGGTVLHIHHQVIADRYPTFLQELMLKNSVARPGLWMELVETEMRLNERYVRKVGSVHLVTPFAPMGFDQFDGIVEGATSIADLKESHIEDLASALGLVLGFYGQLGRSSFNMAIYSSPLDSPEGKGPMPVSFKVLGRSNLRPFYRSDAGYTERLHYESVVNSPPEKVAARMKEFLKKEGKGA